MSVSLCCMARVVAFLYLLMLYKLLYDTNFHALDLNHPECLTFTITLIPAPLAA